MKKAQGILILLLIFVGIPFALLALLWKDRCARTSLSLLPSPSGEFTAETTRVDCGPAMKVATEVTLAKTGDSRDAVSVLVLAEEQGLSAGWDGEKKLVLTLPANAEVVKSRPEWQGIEIAVVGINH